MRPTQAHFLRMTAQEETAQETVSLEGLSGYEKTLLNLNRHRKNLKNIQSTENKVAYKRNHIHEFIPWIEGVLTTGSGLQDEIVIRILIWSLDILEPDNPKLFLELADYVLHHELKMPSDFTRTPATFLAEEIAEKAKVARNLNKPFNLELLNKIDSKTERFDMFDEVKAKLYRERAYLIEDINPHLALDLFERALTLDQSSGVKQHLEKLRKQIEKNQPPNEADVAQDSKSGSSEPN